MSGSKVSKKVKEAIGRNAREQNKLKSEIVSIDEKKMKKRQNELRTVVPNISVDDCGNCPDGLRPLSRALSPRNSLVRPRLPGVESKMSYALTPGGEDFVTSRSRSPSMPATMQPLGLPPIDSSIQGEKSKVCIFYIYYLLLIVPFRSVACVVKEDFSCLVWMTSEVVTITREKTKIPAREKGSRLEATASLC